MSDISSEGRARIDALVQKTGFGRDAVESMWRSLVRGGGRMAQFDHPEFGGPGQWMHGGMLMTADLFDHDLKRRVAQLCDGLSDAAAQESRTEVPRETWYPASLGAPDSSGSQNAARYAWFAGPRRLAVDDGRGVTIYDTGEHRIAGVSQQQAGRGTVSFVSQHGVVDVDRLPVVDPGGRSPAVEPPRPAPTAATTDAAPDPFVALEKLAALHARGIVGDDEFAAKKRELLARI